MTNSLALLQNNVGIGGRSKVLSEAVRTLAEDDTKVDLLTLSDQTSFAQFIDHYQLSEYDLSHRSYSSLLNFPIGTMYQQYLLAYLASSDLSSYDLIFNSNNSLLFLPQEVPTINYIHQPLPAIPTITDRYRDSYLFKTYALPMRVLLRMGSVTNSTNHRILANSQFTADKCEDSWDIVPDAILYPPCIETVRCPSPSKSGVVTLGAFHPNKRQLFQLDVARELPDVEFTLMGRVKSGTSNKYFRKCKRKIERSGLDNVTLRPNAGVETVRAELEGNRVFLHTMRLEEFGISIVEAINHGCIPIVHDSGGPREIVDSEGLRFESLEECVELVRRIVSGDKPKYCEAVAERIEQFTTDRFRDRLSNIRREVGINTASEPAASRNIGSPRKAELSEDEIDVGAGVAETRESIEIDAGPRGDSNLTVEDEERAITPYTLPQDVDPPYRVGIVGAGFAATNLHMPILAGMTDTEVTFVADLNSKRADRVGSQYDALSTTSVDPADLPPCDVALLTVPVGAREGYIKGFAEKDVPMIVEKPFARTSDEHHRFDDLSPLILCNYMRTCFSTTQQVKRIIRSGVFGQLESVDIREEGKIRQTELPQDHYQTDPAQAGGGVLIERGTHTLSQLVEIFGNLGNISNATIQWNQSLDAAVDLSLSLPGVSEDGRVRMSRIDPIGNVARFDFEQATIVFDPGDPSSKVTIELGDEDRPIALAPDPEWATSNHQAAFIRWRQFLSFLEGQTPQCIRTGPQVSENIDRVYAEGRSQ